MSSKQKFSSKDEVYEAIYDKGFEHFFDLPKDLLDADIVFEWLKYAGDSVEAYYAQIPQQWRSEDVLEFVAREGVNVLKDTSPAQTRHYIKLVMLCAVHDYTSLIDVHPQYRNDQELVRAVCNRFPLTLSKVVNAVEWFAPAMSDDLFDECCRNDLQFVLDVSPKLMRDDICKYVDLYRPKIPVFLRSRGRLDLVAETIEVHGWPSSRIDVPSSLEEAVDLVLESNLGQYRETLYMGYVMLFPIEDVVPAMKGARLKKLLLEMYPAEALQPFMKRDKALRGILLEDALGL